MVQGMWRKGMLFIWCVAAFFCPLEAKGTDTEQTQHLLREAESFLKIGYILQKNGLAEKALLAFQKSHALLLQASEQGDKHAKEQLKTLLKIYDAKFSVPKVTAAGSLMADSRWRKSSLPSTVQAKQVNSQIQRLLTKNRNFLETSFRKSKPFIPMIRKEFSHHGLPLELAYLALIESGFDTKVLSHAGARGMWQFMPETARQYGLVVSPTHDERLDPIKSTKAAAMYLKKLHNQFKDWPLALAAYNCGEYRVSKAMQKHNAKNFWQLLQHNALPKETQKYVPSVLAAAIISQNIHKYGLTP